MTTSIYLLEARQIPATPDTVAVQALRFAVSPDDAAFWIWTANCPQGTDAQTFLNNNADSLLNDAQAGSTQAPFALVNGAIQGNTKVLTITGFPFNPWCGKGVQLCLIDVANLTAVPTVSLGVIGPNFADVLPATPLTGFNAVGNLANIQLFTSLATKGTAARATFDVMARVSVAATGAGVRYKVLVKIDGGLFIP